MDRELTKQEKNRSRRRKVWVCAGVLACIAAVIVIVCTTMTRSIKSTEINLAEVDRGDVESSVGASGRVVPMFEEVIVSPITARLLEVYRNAGDSVTAGTPLLRLDLQDAESEVGQLRDSRAQQVNNVEQRRLDNETELTNLEMQIKVKEMSVSQLREEVRNERRLDSLGSGTGDRVRQAELAHRTAAIELEQLKRQLANRRRALAAALGNERLGLAIAERNLGDRARTLEDARLRASRSATLTYINTNVGSMVQQGEKIATLADLSRLKVDAEIGEGNARYLANGGPAIIRVSGKKIPGTIVNVTPTANGGAVKFSVIPSAQGDALHPGAAADVYVILDTHHDVTRIPLGSYYSGGPGEYRLYVDDGDGVITKRKVRLGDANYEYVEVKEGLTPGQKVVISDMSTHKEAKLKIKK